MPTSCVASSSDDYVTYGTYYSWSCSSCGSGSNDDDNSNALAAGGIIGVIFGIVIFMTCACGGLLWYVYYRNRLAMSAQGDGGKEIF